MKKNTMQMRLDALSQNEAFARVVVGAFFSQLNPTLEELADVKTAVSEAITNAVVHAYQGKGGQIEITVELEGEGMTVTIRDFGKGIEDVDKAMQPFYTTGPAEERSGMGFAVMQAFMDEMTVSSEVGKGTSVTMKKKVAEIVEEGKPDVCEQ